MPGTRLLKLNDTNVAVQKGLQAQAQAANAASSAAAKAKAAAAANKDAGAGSARAGRKDGRGTKRGREEVGAVLCVLRRKGRGANVGQDESSRKPDMRLNVPELLKVILVDDWEAVTKNNQVCGVSFWWRI